MTINDQVISQLHADEAASRQEALRLDAEDTLKDLRNEFIFPTKVDLKSKTMMDRSSRDISSEEPCLYLCGNSLGLQPKLVSQRVAEHLAYWAQKAVTGHFTDIDDSNLRKWTDADDAPTEIMASMVGARPDEVAAMETLTANLHILMASFYRPTKDRYKIIVEGKAFPSDHYAVESQLRQHGYSARDGLVTIFPEAPAQTLTTSQILAVLDEHASSAALVLLPGIQYYSGQLLDIQRITAHAKSLGLTIGWDLAHAAGNVPLQLHDWDVDFAAWCHYKYINAGPGAIAGLFVHERHANIDKAALGGPDEDLEKAYKHRLTGWWGYDKGARFNMNTIPEKGASTAFVPRPGAAGFQLGNPCIIALAALEGALEPFGRTGMQALRNKSVSTTAFLEKLLDWHLDHFWDVTGAAQDDDTAAATTTTTTTTTNGDSEPPAKRARGSQPFWIITPRDPEQRGAQLSIQLQEGMLDSVMEGLETHGVVVDERRPDVVRVAPAPLYNSYEDCWRFAHIFSEICRATLIDGYKARLA